MSYLVKCIGANGASVPKKIETMEHEVNNWTYGMIDTVSDAVIDLYRANSTVFTIMGRSGALTPGTESGVAVVSGRAWQLEPGVLHHHVGHGRDLRHSGDALGGLDGGELGFVHGLHGLGDQVLDGRLVQLALQVEFP